MKYRIASILICFFTFVSATGALAKDIDLKAYGAKADGKTKCTAVLQKAIDEVSKAGGGRVILRGGTFLVTPFEIKSGVDLHIEADAVLLASPDLADYPERENPRHYDSAAVPRWRNASIIYADEAENIAISGRGTIDCNGKAHVREKTDPNWKGMQYERIAPRRESLPRVVFFAGCKNVSITDVTMTNQPAGWSYWIHDCDCVKFDRCNILADVRYPNNDGIHINSCRDVTISNCFVETGDDAIIIRANNRSLKENKVCERVVVTNCTLHSWSSGVRIAWSNDGTIRNCCLSNLTIFDTCIGICCVCPEPSTYSNDYGREPTVVENISFSDIQMDEIYGNAILFNVGKSDAILFGGFRNISFSNVNCHKVAEFPYISGSDKAAAENFSFDNCSFERIPIDELPLDYKRHGFAGTKGLGDEKNTKNIIYNNTRFTSK